MVCEWGMSDQLGPLSFGEKQEQIFLGREMSKHRNYSEATAVLIDKEIHKFVNDGYDCAKKILEEHFELLKVIADALLLRESLNGDELDQLIRGEKLDAHIEPAKNKPAVVSQQEEKPVVEEQPEPTDENNLDTGSQLPGNTSTT
jgi:cell division protease FtsH